MRANEVLRSWRRETILEGYGRRYRNCIRLDDRIISFRKVRVLLSWSCTPNPMPSRLGKVTSRGENGIDHNCPLVLNPLQNAVPRRV